MATSIAKQITVFDSQGNHVAVSWNDSGEQCTLMSNRFGTFAVKADEMELLYDALKELFG